MVECLIGVFNHVGFFVSRGAPVGDSLTAVRLLNEDLTMFEYVLTGSGTTRQVTSFVFDAVRAQVAKIKLDDVFEKKIVAASGDGD